MSESRVNALTGPTALAAMAALALCGGAIAWAQEDAGTDAGATTDGEWRYDVSCATCHGWDGQGIYAFGIPLRENPFVLNAPDEAVIQVIRQGRFNRGRAYRDYPGMPGFEFIRDDEAQALVEYMRGPLQER